MVEKESERLLPFAQAVVVRAQLPHGPADEPEEDGVARISGQDEQAHADQHVHARLKGNHVGIQQAHSGIVEGAYGIECANPVRIEAILPSHCWTIHPDICTKAQSTEELPEDQVRWNQVIEETDRSILQTT